MNQSRKKTVKRSVIITLVLFLLISFIGSTYARYTSSANGEGNVDIAKWAVKVNDTDISKATTDFPLTFTTDTNADIVSGKIAPGGTATAYVDVDLTGTEVSVNFDCALAENATDNLKAVFGENYESQVSLSVGTPVLEGTTSNMTLDAANKVVRVGTAAMSGKVRVPIVLTWVNKTENDAADTKTGADQTNVTIPVALTVQQNIA